MHVVVPATSFPQVRFAPELQQTVDPAGELVPQSLPYSLVVLVQVEVPPDPEVATHAVPLKVVLGGHWQYPVLLQVVF